MQYINTYSYVTLVYTSITERLHDDGTSDLIRGLLLVDNILFLAQVIRDAVVLHLVQWLRLDILMKNPLLDTIWDLLQAVGGIYMCGDSENLVQFF